MCFRLLPSRRRSFLSLFRARTTASPRVSLSSLPTEIKDHIVDLLVERECDEHSLTGESLLDLGAMRRMSREWYALVESRYWKVFVIGREDTLERVQRFAQVVAPRHATHIQTCYIEDMRERFNEAYHQILTSLSNLQQLIIERSDGDAGTCYITLLPSHGPLTNLHLGSCRGCSFDPAPVALVLRTHASITRLTLEGVKEDTLGHLEASIKSLLDLRHLQLSRATGTLLRQLSTPLTRLSVEVQWGANLEAHISLIKSVADTLEYLGLRRKGFYFPIRLGKVLNAWPTSLPCLRSLDFDAPFEWSILSLLASSPLASLHLDRFGLSGSDNDPHTLLTVVQAHQATLKSVKFGFHLADQSVITSQMQQTGWSEVEKFCAQHEITWEDGVSGSSF